MASALSLLLSMVVLAGCERADQDASKTKRVTLENPRIAVTLVDPGREPLAPLRYRTRKLAVPTTYDVVTKVDHRWRDLPSEPPITVTVRFERKVGDVRPDGTILDVGLYREVRFDRQPQDPVLARYALIQGATFENWIDTRGALVGPTTATLDARLESGDYDTDSTQVAMVFPEEPIGVGARWEIDARLPRAHAVIRAQLVDRDDDRVEIRTTFDHENSDVPGLERSTGTGDLRLALDGSDATASYVERASGMVQGHAITREITVTLTRVAP